MISAIQQIEYNAQIDMRILLADDNMINRKVMLQMLRRMGYCADVASDGAEVLKVLEEKTYDLILMDIQMPGIDGIEATKRIRALWPGGPVIMAVTAYAADGDRERCLEAGMDGYLSKPIRLEELKDAMLQYEAWVAQRALSG